MPTILPAESTGSESTGPESTGPDIAVFLQTSPYRPYNSQFASTGLLSSDIKGTVCTIHMNSVRENTTCSWFVLQHVCHTYDIHSNNDCGIVRFDCMH